MPAIRFEATLFKVHDWTLLKLPQNVSAKLPSRGMVFAEGSLDGVNFQVPLEPDGKGSHWFRVDDDLFEKIEANAGDTVNVEMESMKEWPRPEIPQDLKQALTKVPEAQALWTKITPKAQWEWIRWTRATNRQETRAKRLEVACSKLKSGMRRPCCFNSSMCTEPYVSKTGMLLEPSEVL